VRYEDLLLMTCFGFVEPVPVNLPVGLYAELSHVYDRLGLLSQRDYAAFMVGCVTGFRERLRGYDADSYTPLAWNFLERRVPANSITLLKDTLVGSGFLEEDPDGPVWFPSRPGAGRSCHYRLGEWWRRVDPELVRLHGAELRRKLYRVEAAGPAFAAGSVHAAIERWAHQLSLAPDAPERGGTFELERLRSGHRWCWTCEQGRVFTSLAAVDCG
jgi:hypothetical protein